MKKALCIPIILCFILYGCSKQAFTSEELEKTKQETIVLSGYRQDEVEERLISCVSALYAPSSKEDMVSAIESIADMVTEEEYNALMKELNYTNTSTEIMQMNVYYCNKENSTDGRAREYVDIKVSAGSYNMMYLIEFVINSDSKIFQHKVWSY